MFKFEAPAIATVEIRNAELGDTDDFDFRQVSSRTRAGILKTFRDPNKEALNTYGYQFTTLTETKRDEIKTFLIDTAGFIITLTDHNLVIRNGVVLASGFEMVTINDLCSYSFNLSFLELDVETDGIPADLFSRITEDEEIRITEDSITRVVENE